MPYVVEVAVEFEIRRKVIVVVEHTIGAGEWWKSEFR